MLEGKKERLLAEMEKEMQEASAAVATSRRPPACATRSRRCENLSLRGEVDRDVQPEVFQIEPKKGLLGLRKVLGPAADAADHRGHRHRPPGRRRDGGVAGVVHRRPAVQAGLSPLPHPDGGGGGRLRVDPRGRVAPLPRRQHKGSYEEERIFPDILLIDGGKGQLNAALDVFRMLGSEPPCLISLAKREEEIYRPARRSRSA